jgi:hypothetical protein
LTRVAWVRVEGPLGGLFGHGVASTIGGVALDGLGVATSVTGATSPLLRLYFGIISEFLRRLV